MIWFSSDWHLGHANIIKYSRRPFLGQEDKNKMDQGLISYQDHKWRPDKESITLMDNSIINNINQVVMPKDELWFLGDFCFGSKDSYYKTARAYRDRINCDNIFMIKGNHDRECICNLFTDMFDMKEISHNGQKIVLCHYAMRVWNKSHRGTWHLYGHSHGSLPDDPNSQSFDCGIDCHNYKPLSFFDVGRIMSKKTWKPIDHHED